LARDNPSVYLSGPITGQTPGGAKVWRDYAEDHLSQAGITVYSPMRMEKYLDHIGNGVYGPEVFNVSYGSVPIEAQGLVTRDRFDVQTCDVMLMYLCDARQISVGTMIELGMADAFRTPVVAVMEEDNLHVHPMVTAIAGYVVKTLDQGLEIVEAILLP